MSQQGGVHFEQGSQNLVVPAGHEINVEAGGALKVADVDLTAALAAGVETPVAGVAAGYKVARGVSAVTGTLEITSGLATVIAAVACLAEDLSLAGLGATVEIPTQTGGDAGKFTAKVWKATASGDVTPLAADAAKSVAWVAVGT